MVQPTQAGPGNHGRVRCWLWLDPAGVDELYDLRADPAELNNLAGRAETRAAQERLARRLLSHLRECGDAPAASKLEIALAAQADGSGPRRPAYASFPITLGPTAACPT